MDPLKSKSPLIVYLDVKSPFAYLAKDFTYRLEADFGIEADWRPLTLNIPSFLGSARTDDEGHVVESNRSTRQWQVVRYEYMDAKRYARMRDIQIYGPKKIWDTSSVHIGWIWSEKFGSSVRRSYLDHVFLEFWKRALDVEDLNVIESELSRAGAAIDGFRDFAAGEGRRQHDQIQESLHPAGIFGVPTYVVENEIFFGRENLPMIRWILGGRVGSPPDIAYPDVALTQS